MERNCSHTTCKPAQSLRRSRMLAPEFNGSGMHFIICVADHRHPETASAHPRCSTWICPLRSRARLLVRSASFLSLPIMYSYVRAAVRNVLVHDVIGRFGDTRCRHAMFFSNPQQCATSGPQFDHAQNEFVIFTRCAVAHGQPPARTACTCSISGSGSNSSRTASDRASRCSAASDSASRSVSSAA